MDPKPALAPRHQCLGQRVALARALVHDPQNAILHETTNGLDERDGVDLAEREHEHHEGGAHQPARGDRPPDPPRPHQRSRAEHPGRLGEITKIDVLDTGTGGRPAALYRFRREVLRERRASGVGLGRR